MVTVTEKYLKFAEKVALNNDLRRQLSAIQPGDSTALLALANSQGYNFTVEELQEASRETSMVVTTENGELSDDQLDQVNGGLLVVIAIIAILIG